MNYSGDVGASILLSMELAEENSLGSGIYQVLRMAENTVAIDWALSQACYNCSFNEAIT